MARAKRRLITTTVYVDEGKMEALEALSERTRIPRARLIRDGLDLMLERHTTEDGDGKG